MKTECLKYTINIIDIIRQYIQLLLFTVFVETSDVSRYYSTTYHNWFSKSRNYFVVLKIKHILLLLWNKIMKVSYPYKQRSTNASPRNYQTAKENPLWLFFSTHPLLPRKSWKVIQGHLVYDSIIRSRWDKYLKQLFSMHLLFQNLNIKTNLEDFKDLL